MQECYPFITGAEHNKHKTYVYLVTLAYACVTRFCFNANKWKQKTEMKEKDVAVFHAYGMEYNSDHCAFAIRRNAENLLAAY